MLIDMLWSIFCGIWYVVGSLVGLSAALILVIVVAAIIKGALQ